MTAEISRIALIGLGQIAQAVHLPTIAANPRFELVAAVSLNGTIEGIPSFDTIENALAGGPQFDAATLATPPQGRFDLARAALAAGKHVMLEKPPGVSLAEVMALERLATARGLSLFVSGIHGPRRRWRPRPSGCPAGSCSPSRSRGLRIYAVGIPARIGFWHQAEWVFDPGINALSILTAILPEDFALRRAVLRVPANRQAAISASLNFRTVGGATILAEFDFLHEGRARWDIAIATETGTLTLRQRGGEMHVDGARMHLGAVDEYKVLYNRFAELIDARAVEVDLAPMIHVADACLLGERSQVDAFEW